MVWYHCVSSRLVLSTIILLVYQHVGMVFGCGVVVRFTCHTPDSSFQWPSRNMRPFFSTLMCVAENVAVYPSSHSFPMNIISHDWRHRWELTVIHYHKTMVIYPYYFKCPFTKMFSWIIFINDCICILTGSPGNIFDNRLCYTRQLGVTRIPQLSQRNC